MGRRIAARRIGAQYQKKPLNMPKPPAPPARTQWLDQGPAFSSSGHSAYSFSYDQTAYYRGNRHTSDFEYVPGYTMPRLSWIQKYNGSWLESSLLYNFVLVLGRFHRDHRLSASFETDLHVSTRMKFVCVTYFVLSTQCFHAC